MRLALLCFTVTGLALTGCSGNSGSAENGKWKTISASPNAEKNSSEAPSDGTKKGSFIANLPAGFEQPADDVGTRMLREYGAVFVARGGAIVPGVVVFKNSDEVSTFQAGANGVSDSIGGIAIVLQNAALSALKDAVREAGQSGVSITPRGSDASKRSYLDTVELWASRVNPGLDHWVGKGRMSAAEAARIRSLTPFEQVPEIFRLEKEGIYFSKDLQKSIIYSVAPPGTSQHLSMLAFDVSEHDNAMVREILAKHGWFQTVVSDLPHFTFLGVPQSDLTKLGLKKVFDGGRTFWVPAI